MTTVILGTEAQATAAIMDPWALSLSVLDSAWASETKTLIKQWDDSVNNKLQPVNSAVTALKLGLGD